MLVVGVKVLVINVLSIRSDLCCCCVALLLISDVMCKMDEQLLSMHVMCVSMNVRYQWSFGCDLC